jgi:hypothetical protein
MVYQTVSRNIRVLETYFKARRRILQNYFKRSRIHVQIWQVSKSIGLETGALGSFFFFF